MSVKTFIIQLDSEKLGKEVRVSYFIIRLVIHPYEAQGLQPRR